MSDLERIVGVALHCRSVLSNDGRAAVDRILFMPIPARHGEVMEWADEMGLDATHDPDNQGFLTSHGSWVTREKARALAVAAGQIHPDATLHQSQLFSEDLW